MWSEDLNDKDKMVKFVEYIGNIQQNKNTAMKGRIAGLTTFKMRTFVHTTDMFNRRLTGKCYNVYTRGRINI